MTSPDRDQPPADPPEAVPIRCRDGALLCRVEVWDEARWHATPPERRPARAAFVAGLGWVVARPEELLN